MASTVSSIPNGNLQGITYTTSDGRTTALRDLLKTHEVRPEVERRIDDGSRHAIYIKPRHLSTFEKEPPLYTKEYGMDDIFNYVLSKSDLDTQNMYTNFTVPKQKTIKFLFEFFSNIIKNKTTFFSSELGLTANERGRPLALLSQAGVLQRKGIRGQGANKYKYLVPDHLKSNEDILLQLIVNADSIIGMGTKAREAAQQRAGVRDESEVRHVQLDGEKDLSKTNPDLEMTPLVPQAVPMPPHDNIQSFNDGWMHFSRLFPKLGFEQYLKMVYENSNA